MDDKKTCNDQTSLVISLDNLLPPFMAEKAENIGVAKANMDVITMFMLAFLAGAFIALGAGFFTVVTTGAQNVVGFGLSRMIGGLAFCLGLILVIIAGAELFTGNNLIIMATISRKVSIPKLLRNWLVVYIGNLVGSTATAYFVFLSRQYDLHDGAVGAAAVAIANIKCNPEIGFAPYFYKGIFCNVLVCLAVWLCFSTQTCFGKILCIIFPITAFVASGFEHCVANMYFIPMGIFIKHTLAGSLTVEAAHITWYNFFITNLVPVTLGNVVGGAGCVGGVYWLIYRRNILKKFLAKDQ